jgi:hypothetical protein
MQSFNIFGARDGFLFEFTSLSRVWKFENHLTGRACMSAVHFRLTAQDGRPVQRAAPVPLGHAHHRESTRRRWPPVSLPHVACPPPPLTTSPDVTEGGVSHLTLSPASFGRGPRCSTPCQPLLCLHCPSSMSRPELSDRTQRSASSPCPSCTESLPTAPASQTGPRDFPAVIFLHEHLTGSSLLRLFPHPVDPAASSALPRSSSPTSSSTTSTTPSAPHWRLLPVGIRAATESPPRSRSSDCFPLVYSRPSPSMRRC